MNMNQKVIRNISSMLKLFLAVKDHRVWGMDIAQVYYHLWIRMQQKLAVKPFLLLQESRSPPTTSIAKYLKFVLILSSLWTFFLLTSCDILNYVIM